MIHAIFAHDKKYGIGKNNVIPWHIPDDFKHFKECTSGFPIVMGRNTYLSLLQLNGKPLPDRHHVVITDQPIDIAPEWQDVVTEAFSIDKAIAAAQKINSTIWIIGGGSIYDQCIPLCDRLYVTFIDAVFECDTFIKPYPQFTKEISHETHSYNDLTYHFIVLEKP